MADVEGLFINAGTDSMPRIACRVVSPIKRALYMIMKKQFLCAIVLATLGAATSTGVQAAAVNSGDILHITSATYNNTTTGYVSGGSYFSMDMNGDGVVQVYEKTGLSEGTAGLVIGTATVPGVYHAGAPLPTDTGPIVQTWGFFGSAGTNFLTVPATGSTTAGLDLSGWTVAWNNVPEINMGSSAWQPVNCAELGCTGYTFMSGVARFQWDGIYGNAYTLDYTATVPIYGKTSFGGEPYFLHLEGTVQAVPIPAAVWLFGSGLLGLVGVARRKMKGV